MISRLCLSYALFDRDRASAIARLLESRGVSVQRRSVESATGPRSATENEIADCGAWILLCSTHAIESTSFEREITLALTVGKPVLTILLDSSSLPDALAGRPFLELDGRTAREWLPDLTRLLTSLPMAEDSPQVAWSTSHPLETLIYTPAHPEPHSEAATVVAVRPSLTIPGFQIKGRLGHGGMADVYLAEDIGLKRLVAVKVMSDTLSNDDQFRRRFSEEGQTVAKFRHPSIVTVFASGQVDEQRYILMEYVAGGTLSDRIKDGPLHARDALPIATAIADALRYAHERGIIHRDVKPGNILFTAANEPILSDFGIAKSTARDSVETAPGAVIGSPKYMSPEQLMGEEVTERTDVYSLGLVLFEALTGNVPKREFSIVRSENDEESLENALRTDARFCGAFISACLRLNPQDRPSAQQCVAALKALAQDRTPIRKRRRPIPTAYVAITALASVIGAVWWLLFAEPVTPANTATFDVTPSGSTVVVDGKKLMGREISIGPGTHQVAVVEKHSYGQLLAIDGSKPGRHEIALNPISLPTEAEFTEFTNRFFEDGSDADVPPESSGIRYPPYVALLNLYAQQRQPRPALVDQQINDMRALAQAGDPTAKLKLFLLADENLIDEPTDTKENWLRESSEDGYALASFYRALQFRATRQIDGALDTVSLKEYRDLLRLARQQGLDFADARIREADDILGGSTL